MRIISVASFLCKNNLAFQENNGKIDVEDNENFLGLIEMVSEFDLLMRQHI